MTFTQEQAVKILNGKLTNDGKKTLRMSEKSLNALVETLLPLLATDETGIDDFVKTVEPICSTFNGNVEKDRTTFINQWKKDHSETDPAANNNAANQASESPELKAALERIAALEAKDAENAKKATIAQKRKDVVSKLKEKGVKDENWLNDFLSEVNIGDDFDVEAKAESWLKLYNKFKANGGSSVPPENPAGSATNSAWMQSIKAAAELGKKEQAKVEPNKQ